MKLRLTKRWLIALTIGALLVGLLGYAGLRVKRFLTVPPSAVAAERLVLIEPGMSLRRVVDLLAAHDVIREKYLFLALARAYRRGKTVKAGEYLLTTAMLPTAVLTKLQDGKIYVRSVTIPEGYTARQIADTLAEHGFGDRQTLLDLMFDEVFATELRIPAASLEGYLFPNTYHVTRGLTERDLLQKMVAEFWRIITPEIEQEIQRQGFTLHEIVTLASIIEKEARVPAERVLISAVYRNRLKIKMKLDSDPTVIYGITEFSGNLTRADLQADSPYNTYRRRGLPPGPIANPGQATLLAALRPADVKYLYFVAKNDGSHYFSANYQEHLRAVRQYQKQRRRAPSAAAAESLAP